MHAMDLFRGKNRLWGILFGFSLGLLLSACQAGLTSPTPHLAAPSAASLPSSTAIPASPSPQPTATSLATPSASPTASPMASPMASPTAAPPTTPPLASPLASPSASPTAAPPPTASPMISASPPPPSASPTPPIAAGCADKAAFYGDVTIPDDTAFDQAASFTKTWRFRNEGDCTWDSSYALVFAGGEMLNAPLVRLLAASVAPGQIAELSLEMRTPDRGGVFRSYWEFQNGQGVRFGTGAGGHDPFWVQVVVSWMPPGGGSPAGSGQENSGGDQPTPPPGGVSSPDPAQGQSQISLPGVPAGCAAGDNPGYLQALLNLINRARRDHNLEELSPSAPLYTAAAVHSADMACNNFINHIGSDGSSWYTRIAAQGYAYSTALENIVVGNPDFGGDAQYAFDWWMNSQVHRDNILNPKVTELGLGYVYNPASEYGGYFTLVLARP